MRHGVQDWEDPQLRIFDPQPSPARLLPPPPRLRTASPGTHSVSLGAANATNVAIYATTSARHAAPFFQKSWQPRARWWEAHILVARHVEQLLLGPAFLAGLVADCLRQASDRLSATDGLVGYPKRRGCRLVTPRRTAQLSHRLWVILPDRQLPPFVDVIGALSDEPAVNGTVVPTLGTASSSCAAAPD